MLFKVYLCSLTVFYILATCTAHTPSTGQNDISRGISAKGLLEKITSTFMTRSGVESSQVISLNLSNVLILLLLKAIIYSAGVLGTSGLGVKVHHPEFARSSDGQENPIVSDTEVLLYLGYLSGSTGNFSCLENVACHRPEQSTPYVKAGGLLLKAARIIPNIVEIDPEHEKTVIDLRQAVEYGKAGGDCDAQFGCSNT